MISRRQNAFYWSLWARAKRVLLNGRETFTGDEENKRRHELHIRAIGRDKSHYDLTNREFDSRDRRAARVDHLFAEANRLGMDEPTGTMMEKMVEDAEFDTLWHPFQKAKEHDQDMATMNTKQIAEEIKRIQRGVTSFSNEMRKKKIHVGIGKNPVCVTCGIRWPCPESRAAHATERKQ